APDPGSARAHSGALSTRTGQWGFWVGAAPFVGRGRPAIGVIAAAAQGEVAERIYPMDDDPDRAIALGVSVGRWDLRQSGVGQGEGGVAGCDRSEERRQQVFFGLGSRLS